MRIARQACVAGGDASELLDPAEEALDEVAVLILMSIKWALDEAMTAWRNHRFDFVGGQIVDDGVGIVGLAALSEPGSERLEQRQRLRAIAGLTAGEGKAGQRPEPFDNGVNFGTQSAARTPQRLVSFFWRTCGMLMGTDDGAVDEKLFEVLRVLGQLGDT